MPFVVTGISQDGNTTALEAAIRAAGLTLDPLEVIGPDDGDLPVAGGIAPSGIITGGGLETGTGVPGLTSTASLPPIAGDSLWDRLADLAIPDDELENYAEALEAGRSIVAYHGSAANVANVEGLFSAGGLANVRTF